MPAPRLPGLSEIANSISRRFKPADVDAIHKDIDRGRREMISGQRIISDEKIDDAKNYGRSWREVESQREELNWIEQQLRARFGLNDEQFRKQNPRGWLDRYDQMGKQMAPIRQLRRELLDETGRRGKADTLTPDDSDSTQITERSFIERLLKNYIKESLGARAPKQSEGFHSDLSEEMRQQITPQRGR